jgi:predicted NBD/HSP70 family sugar kinase
VREAFKHLTLSGPTPRQKLAEAAGITDRTLRSRMKPFLESGLMRRTGKKGMDVGLGDQAGAVLVVAVSRWHLRIAIVSADVEVLHIVEHEDPLFPEGGEAISRKNLKRLIREKSEQLRAELSQPVCPVSTVISWYTRVSLETGEPVPYETIAGWQNHDVRHLVRDALRAAGFPSITPTVLNDADAEALGEATIGGHSARPLIVVKVSGSIGAGCVIDGPVLFRGSQGYAGELGHVPAVALRPTSNSLLDDLSEDKDCTCGRKRHVQCYASMQAIVDRLAEHVKGLDAPLPTAARTLKREWDNVVVHAAFEESGAIIGDALLGAVAMLDPPEVIIRTRDYMVNERLLVGVKNALEGLPNAPHVKWGSLDEANFVVRGAAVYAIQEHIYPRLELAANNRGARIEPLEPLEPSAA